MARLVYRGEKIKQHAGGFSFTRDVPKEVPLESLDGRSRKQIEDNPDIVEASKSAGPGPTAIENVIATPDYEPPPGHQIPQRVAKKSSRKKRGSKKD